MAKTQNPAKDMTTPSCWICLEEGTDEHNLPLVRNCACRGNSGYAHISCLASFAKSRTDAMSVTAFTDSISECTGTPWSECHMCKTTFQDTLRMDLAKKWMEAVQELPDTSCHRIVAQLNYAETPMLNASSYTSKECDESIEIVESILQVLQDVTPAMVDNFIERGGNSDDRESDINPAFYAYVRHYCLMLLSQAHSNLGNREKAQEYGDKLIEWGCKTGVCTEEESRDLMELLNRRSVGLNPSGKGDANNGLGVFNEFYESAVSRGGKDHPDAIKAAACVGDEYVEQMKGKEAIPWFVDALQRATRVFGHEHPETIMIKKRYLMIVPMFSSRKGTLVTKDPNLNGTEVTILRTAKDGQKYIVETQAGKLKVLPSQLIFAQHTPVSLTSRGETFTVFIDSFLKDTDKYRIFMYSGVGENSTHLYDNVNRYSVRVFFADQSLLDVLGGF